MRIGKDVSLSTCHKEGYTVIEFKVRELFPNGRKYGMNKNCGVSIFQSIPEYLRKNMANEFDPFGSRRILDVFYSFDDLLEVYTKHKEKIDKFGDLHNNPININNPTEYDLLNLADIINSYCGL